MSAYKVARHPHNPGLWIVRSTNKATIHSVYVTKEAATAAAREVNAGSASRNSRVRAGKKPKW